MPHSSIIGKAMLCIAWLLVLGAANCSALGQDEPGQAEPGESVPEDSEPRNRVGDQNGEDEPPPHVPRIVQPYELHVQAGVWLPRLAGEVARGNTSDSIILETELDLDQSDAIFNGEVALRKNQDWEIAFGGFDFSTQATVENFIRDESFGSVEIDRGDDVRSTFDLTSFWGEVVPGSWRAFRDPDPKTPDLENITHEGHYVMDLRLMPRLGMRTFDLEHSLENLDTGAREEIEAAWLAFYGGLAAEMQYRPPHPKPWLDLFELEVGGNIGPALGSDSGFMTEVRAGINWHFSRNAGLTAGYRLVGLFVEDDDYELDGVVAGLFFGGSLRF